MASESVVQSARQRARAEVTREIVAAARRHLAIEGASGLSLRAVARDLGMVSSAIYRYVASRDELLTLLIIDAYDAMGEAAAAAEGRVPRPDLIGRWSGICHAVRSWALAHPHEYALVYGSPVPGYRAPEDTVRAATRITVLLTGILVDATAARSADGAWDREPDELTRAALVPSRVLIPEQVPSELVIRGLMAWTYLFGAVSFEIFGHRHQILSDEPAPLDAFFAEEVTRIGEFVGIGQ